MSKIRLFSIDFSRLFSAMRLAKRTFGEYKKQIIVLIILGFLSGIFEAVGINALVPLFSFFVDDGNRVGSDFVANLIKDIMAFIHLPFSLSFLLVFICILFILKAFATLYFNYIRMKIRTDYEYKKMNELYSGTLNSNWMYLSKQKIGHLETVVMTDVRQNGGLLENIARAIGILAEFLMYLFVAVNISQAVTLMTLVLGGIIFFVFKPLLFKVRQYAKRTEHINKEVSHHVNESISGIKIIKASGSEGYFSKAGEIFFDQLRNLQMKSFMIQNYVLSFIQPISVVFIVIVVAFAYYNTSYNLGALAAIIYLIQKMFGHVQSLQSFAQMISGSVPYVQGMFEYEEAAKKYNENVDQKPSKHFLFSEKMRLKNINFSYETNIPTLNGISFDIEKGSFIGIIGKSGSGKTTLFDIILRLLKPESGEISIDNIDMNDIDIKEWRNHIAYVSQDAFLLNDTIQNNITFYNSEIKIDKINEIVSMVHLEEFINSLPDGLNTIVGERGTRLSGGQKQRIAIARALARNPEILLLDEATSALDLESESFIQQTVMDLKGKMTILIIAHRLSTVSNSDKLIVMENGQIIESGKPSDLLKDRATYYSRMYNIRS